MEFIIIAILILLNGLFAMAEMSLVSARKFSLEKDQKKGKAGAKTALELMESPTRFLSTVQIGITIIGVLLGIYSGDTITIQLAEVMETVPELRDYSETIALTIVVLIITFLSILFGELLPKKIALIYPEKIAVVLSRPMKILSRITAPLVWLLTRSNELLLGMLGISSKRKDILTEEEIKHLIKESTTEGEIQDIEHEIVDRVFELGDRKIESLMTHRKDVVFLDLTDDLKSIQSKVIENPHGAYPVTQNHNTDKIAGIVILKDLFEGFVEPTFVLSSVIKDPLFLFESTPAYKMLDLFKEKKMHYAVITDEYGAMQGFVTMDDVIDALLGDITTDTVQDYVIEKRDENSWLADGQFSFSEFIRKFKLTDIQPSEQFHTLGGYIIHEHKSIPKTGTQVKIGPLKLEVIDMDGPRIDKIMIIRG